MLARQISLDFSNSELKFLCVFVLSGSFDIIVAVNLCWPGWIHSNHALFYPFDDFYCI